jgi:uncharacterized protein (TIGR02001 family)
MKMPQYVMWKAKAGLAAIALAMTAGVAMADGYVKGSVKDAPAEEPKRDLAVSYNFSVTSDYIFRGFSQSKEQPTVQGGIDVTYKWFYAGMWSSGIDFGKVGNQDVAHIETDLYAGIKPVVGRFTFDFGVIYYTYPKGRDFGKELDYVELKAGVSTELWKDGTAGVTAYWSPEGTSKTGEIWTFEGSFAQVLPKIRDIVPTFSAALGYQVGEGSNANYTTFIGSDNYTYWNAGLTLGFHERFSVDFRYWDTNIDTSVCPVSTFNCDARFVATAKYTY